MFAMADALSGAVEDIRAMRVRGAAAIATRAAKALAEHVAGESGRERDIARLKEAARKAARQLAGSRPTAVSLRHGLEPVLAAVEAAPDAEAAGQAATRAARRLADAVKQWEKAIARHGAVAMKRGERVLTHCHSSTVVSLLATAFAEGKVEEAYVTETRPFRQGLITSRWLREAGIPTTLIVDSAVLHVLRTANVDRVVVGADTVARDGSLFNKVGTSLVALAASSEGIPFWSAASAIKFSAQGPEAVVVEEREAVEVAGATELAKGVRIHNPVFDRTPAAHVTGYVTEEGVLPPRQAVDAALLRLRGIA